MSTTQQYLSLDVAYQYYNKHLFEGKLPTCLITLQRKKCYGYFHADRFAGKNGNSNKKTDEIALNPDHFGRTDKEVLGTLVHEMVHLWQAHFGTPSRVSYHNAEWAFKMEEIGLMPSTTGEPGGKRTGQKMTHYVIEGGLFEKLTDNLLRIQGGIIEWKSFVEGGATTKPKTKSKVKYTCSACGQNAWAKPGASLICGLCELAMECQA
jgi:predicted SprT family Zn-dependent metalloprotease